MQIIPSVLFLVAFFLFCLHHKRVEQSEKLQRLVCAMTGFASALLALLILDNWNGWGGDFSQYIAQARAIVTHTIESQVQNNLFIINHSPPFTADPVYPWGFPLMLAPFYVLFGENLFALKIPVVLCFFCSTILSNRLFRKHFSFFQAELLTLFISVNPVFIFFCNSPLSDIPFLCLSLAALLSIERLFSVADKKKQTFAGVSAGICTFLAFMTRSNGIVFPCLLFSLHILMLANKKERVGRFLSKRGFSGFADPFFPAHVCAYAIFFAAVLIQHSLLPQAGSTHMTYLKYISISSIAKNIVYYIRLAPTFFPFGQTFPLSLASTSAAAMLLPFLWYGLVRFMPKNPILFLYVLGSASILILWPTQQGIRFLFPIIPPLIVFTALGTGAAFQKHKNPPLHRIAVALEILAVIACIAIYALRASLPKSDDGPYSSDAKAMYSFIMEETPENAKIMFFKPRVLYLKTGRLGFRGTDISQSTTADYLLLSREDSTFDFNIEQSNPEQFKKLRLVFENNRFKLYKVLDIPVSEKR
ncbi:MAG: glycosyltransferase family 39 protein [Treponema sp.]|nr:glycosyltransferase family 39 protein [Treponema sp.]